MSELIEQGRGQDLTSDIQTMGTDALKKRLAQQMELTAHHLMEMATIWTELENRGEDLSALRTGLTDYLPKIAAGELDAQAVVQFAGNRQLLRYFATLPVERQRQLCAAGVVDIVLPESGTTTQRKLAHLSGREVTQVFGQGIIRNVQEQAQLLESKAATDRALLERKASKAKTAVRITHGALEVDGERVKAANQPLKTEQLLEVLSKHYGVDLMKVVAQQGKR